METEMGAGINMMVDFAVDFGDTHTYIGGMSYPKGYFANAACLFSPLIAHIVAF